MRFVDMLGGLGAEITVGTGTGSPLWFACRAASRGYAGRGSMRTPHSSSSSQLDCTRTLLILVTLSPRPTLNLRLLLRLLLLLLTGTRAKAFCLRIHADASLSLSPPPPPPPPPPRVCLSIHPERLKVRVRHSPISVRRWDRAGQLRARPL